MLLISVANFCGESGDSYVHFSFCYNMPGTVKMHKESGNTNYLSNIFNYAKPQNTATSMAHLQLGEQQEIKDP